MESFFPTFELKLKTALQQLNDSRSQVNKVPSDLQNRKRFQEIECGRILQEKQFHLSACEKALAEAQARIQVQQQQLDDKEDALRRKEETQLHLQKGCFSFSLF